MTHSLAPTRPGLLRTQAFIGGRWLDAPGGRTFEVHDPATGDLVAAVADADPEMGRAAVDAAEAAFSAWRGTLAKTRAAILRRWFDLVNANIDDLARLMSWEQGKPVAEARSELLYSAGYLDWFAEEAKRSYGDVLPTPFEGDELLAVKEPIGIAAAITPWNFPAAMIARKLAPALAAGCTVVAKPATETPLSALALAALAEEAGVPAGVLNIVPTAQTAEVSGVWMADSRVRKVSFTGSTRVGKLLARQGADTLKRLSLELGGDAPFIVFDDADLAVALDGLMKAKFRNTGQACVAANRVYVQEGIHDAFVEKVLAAVGALTIGAASEGEHDLGPLISDRAVANMEALVENATVGGAQLRLGGTRLNRAGSFFAPTVLTDVSPDMRLSCEEIFGPIVAISRFKDEDEAVRRDNASPYGLAAYLFSRDLKKLRRVAGRLETGIVGLNEGAVSTEVAPFGGIKESGYGREGSRYGLAEYQNIKYLCMGDLG
jgi:succinate-semialdehyde dehydrogenase / glutarate-semialdehyde dehydrogenase